MFLQTSDLGFAIYPLKHIIQDVLARNLYKRLLKATYVNHEVIQADVKNMRMFLMHRCFQNLYSVAIFTVPNRPNRECFDHNTLSLTNETYKIPVCECENTRLIDTWVHTLHTVSEV